MDTTWDRKSFEVGGHWPLWRRLKTRLTTQNRQKSNAKKHKNTLLYIKQNTLASYRSYFNSVVIYMCYMINGRNLRYVYVKKYIIS